MPLVTTDYSKATLTTTDTEISKPNKDRISFNFVNYGSNPCWIKLGRTGSGIYLVANGGSYEINLMNPWYDEIYAQAITANTSLAAIEVSKV